MLDTVAWSHRFSDPFGVPSERAIGRAPSPSLPASVLLPCEVPLAVITWSFERHRVRRYLVGASAAGDRAGAFRGPGPRHSRPRAARTRRVRAVPGPPCGGRSTSSDSSTGSCSGSSDRFRYLPAAGLIPLARTGRAGFSAAVFGDVVVRGPVTIDPNRVGALLDESFHHAPIDLERGEVVFLYHVMADGGSVDHIVFCTSRMDFLGDELVIDAVFPGGSLVIGQQIEIRGRNFGFSTAPQG